LQNDVADRRHENDVARTTWLPIGRRVRVQPADHLADERNSVFQGMDGGMALRVQPGCICRNLAGEFMDT